MTLGIHPANLYSGPANNAARKWRALRPRLYRIWQEGFSGHEAASPMRLPKVALNKELWLHRYSKVGGLSSQRVFFSVKSEVGFSQSGGFAKKMGSDRIWRDDAIITTSQPEEFSRKDT